MKKLTTKQPNFLTIEGFKQHLLTIGSETTTEEELKHYYNTNFVIIHEGKRIKIPFDAVSYNAILDAIESIQKEEVF